MKSRFALKNRIRRVMAAFAAAAVFVLSFCGEQAYALESWPDDCYVASDGACLMDADSKVVLFGKSQEEAYYPASITKVLTALLTIENCDNLSEQLTFSYDAVHNLEENSTIIGASEGDRLSVLDCLYCLLFQSANEVANALAEHVGSKFPELKEDGMTDRDVFVKMMNMKAAELGCKNSHFNNPSGLSDDDHYTSAYDMCLIMAAAIKNDTFIDIESRNYWKHAPIRRYPDADDPWNTVYPKHLMMKRNSQQYYQGTIAGKTGYTMHAGNTLVTACRRGDMTLVSCVLNAHANHYNDTIRLMDFGFQNFSSLKVSDYDDTNAIVENDFRLSGIPMVSSATLGIDPDNRITIPKGGSYVEVKKTLHTENDDSLASLVYTYGDRVVGTAGIRLIDLGGRLFVEDAVRDDPLLGTLLGMENPAEPEGEETDAAQTESAEAAAAESSEEQTDAAEAGSGMQDGLTSASADGQDDPPDTEVEKRSRGLVNVFIRIAAAIVCFGIIVVIIRFLIENKENRDRSARRRRRERRNADLSGSQRIEMDLQLQRRLRKTKRKRKG